MDHARKIGKTEVPINWDSRPSPPTSINERPSAMKENLTEDRRLVNWRKWMKDRELHYRQYEKFTGRKREDLLLVRDVDDCRRKLEITEAAQGLGDLNPTIISKYARAGPGFLSSLGYLSKRGNSDLPDIVATPTKARPSFERIALPKLIKREKGLPMTSKPFKPFPKANNYLNIREKQISERIKSLNLREKEMSLLAIEGQRITEKPPRKILKDFMHTRNTNLETFTAENESESEVLETDEDPDAVRLKIQNREVSFERSLQKDEENPEDFTWWLIFESNDFGKYEREIRIENRSDFSITYRWRIHGLGSGFIFPAFRSSPFYFNKNNGILLPGEVVTLSIWFRSEKPQIATESWNLVVDPPISADFLIFRFWGCANFSSNPETRNSLRNFTGLRHKTTESPDAIKNYINHQIRDGIIRDILNSIFDSVERVDLTSLPYDSLFLDREIFCAKNPCYTYNSDLMKEFQQIYEEVTSEDSPPWSLSLEELRGTLLMIKKPEIRNETLTRFNEVCQLALRPNFGDIEFISSRSNFDVPERRIDLKMRIVCSLLCGFANKFEDEMERTISECFRVEVSIDGAPSGDVSRSTSLGSSQMSLTTPRKRTKSRAKKTSKTSIITDDDKNVGSGLDKKIVNGSRLRMEIFHIRIRAILENTILAICAAVDTVNNFNSKNKK